MHQQNSKKYNAFWFSPFHTPQKRRGSHDLMAIFMGVRVPWAFKVSFWYFKHCCCCGNCLAPTAHCGWSFNRESWPSRELYNTSHPDKKENHLQKRLAEDSFSIPIFQFFTVTLLNLSIFSLQGANRLDFRPSSSNSRCPAFSSFVGLMKRSTREVFPDLSGDSWEGKRFPYICWISLKLNLEFLRLESQVWKLHESIGIWIYLGLFLGGRWLQGLLASCPMNPFQKAWFGNQPHVGSLLKCCSCNLPFTTNRPAPPKKKPSTVES